MGTTLVVGAAPTEKAGAVPATEQTAYGLGLGIAVTGTLAVAVYRREMPHEAPATAKDTMDAAIATAEHLPDGATLLTTAKDAFTAGLQTAATASAPFALVAAALVATLLRHVPPIGATTPPTPQPEPEPHTTAAPPVTSRPCVEKGSWAVNDHGSWVGEISRTSSGRCWSRCCRRGRRRGGRPSGPGDS